MVDPIPAITLLPAAPDRTNPGEDYNTVAKTFAAALPPMAVEQNTTIGAINGLLPTIETAADAAEDAEAARDIATTKASEASGSATTAVNAKNDAVTAKGQAETARTGSETARDLAEDYRDQAQAATGLPNQVGHGGKFLMTDGSTSSWEPIRWTQIGTASMSGTSVSFTSIPNTYGALLIDFANINISTTANLLLEISPNGTTWYPYALANALPSSSTRTGAFIFDRYALSSGAIYGGVTASGNTGILATGAPVPADIWMCPGGIGAIRISTSAGTFAAGTVTLYRR